MDLTTRIDLGFVNAELAIDIESACKAEVDDIDWDFLTDMIRDALHDGTIEDLVSTAVSNGEAPSVDGAGIAEELLSEYLGRDALGSSDDTGCHLASSFEKAVRLANQRNTRSAEGSGGGWARDLSATADTVKHLADRVAALEQIVRRLTMADRNHATATDLITSTLNGVTLRGDPIYPTTDNTATDNTAPLLG